jgi:hypothetical protein
MSTIVSISRATGRARCRSTVPCVSGHIPRFVVSGTLHRIFFVPSTITTQLTGPRKKITKTSVKKGKYVYVAVAPTPAMLAIGCDACVGRHSDKNVECMAKTPESLLHKPPGDLYAGHTVVTGVKVNSLTHLTRGRAIPTMLE